MHIELTFMNCQEVEVEIPDDMTLSQWQHSLPRQRERRALNHFTPDADNQKKKKKMATELTDNDAGSSGMRTMESYEDESEEVQEEEEQQEEEEEEEREEEEEEEEPVHLRSEFSSNLLIDFLNIVQKILIHLVECVLHYCCHW
jgi:hypothetical protein